MSDPENPDPKKDQKKDIKPIIEGKAVQRKPGLARRVKDIFFSGDFGDAAKYVATGVLIPAFKKLLVDAVENGVDRVVWGVDRRPNAPGSGASRYRYDTQLPPQRPRGWVPDQPLPPGPTAHNRRSSTSTELVLSNKQDAENVLTNMDTILQQYEVVSVADLLELCGLPNNPVDNTWGWYSLAYADVRPVREGFLINLPPAQAL